MTAQFKLHQDIKLHVKERISESDARRQQLTAQAILERLPEQPGVILADEVGMGKTFVAIAVAVSIALSNRSGGRPVVVMVPSSLKEKWPRDFELFCECCLPADLAKKLRYGRAEKAVDFLKLLDDPIRKRSSLIFMTHGAMSRGLDDPWVKLALIQRSLHRRRNTANLKRALGRNLGDLLQLKRVTRQDSSIWETLLKTPPSDWLRHLAGLIEGMDDDPVPEDICKLLPSLNTDWIYEAIQQIPIRRTKHYKAKLVSARHAIKEELREVWKECLAKFRRRLPLLILDEAHHLKNADTRLAKLFRSQDSFDDAEAIQSGPLAGVFERMLFLTATPFQLGHGELCSVLDRFDGVHWKGKSAPSIGRVGFESARKDLRSSLDRAQESAVALDNAWGKLRESDMQVNGQRIDEVDSWWKLAQETEHVTPATSEVIACFQSTKATMRDAEQLLQPWVLRHLKPRQLLGNVSKPRRERNVGASILLQPHDQNGAGITVSGEALLPFLLASRASACRPESRSVFAEGLASSYEAFLHTRNRNDDAVMDDDEDDNIAFDINDSSAWYLDHLEKLIPRQRDSAMEHPKMDATVGRAVEFWRSGEKVVVFCHYIQTGRTLRRKISSAIQQEILNLGILKLKCETNEVIGELKRLGDRFFDDGPLRRACDRETRSMLDQHPGIAAHGETLIQIVRRNLRTPAFLVRFFPLGSDEPADMLIKNSFDSRDQSGITLREVIGDFFTFLELRCGSKQRKSCIDAVGKIQTGIHFGGATAGFEEDELQGEKPERLLPNVRLVNGQTRSDTRQRLMLTFNTPFYPEVLIASSVMSEGVDLHLNCRHIIHHDLCWNPSNLEQRTGRIDRIGAKAERAGESIQVYLPYIAETQDEKMYRVVMDRERWFNVVMGEDYRIDAKTTDKLANRIPFPNAAAHELAFKLESQREH